MHPPRVAFKNMMRGEEKHGDEKKVDDHEAVERTVSRGVEERREKRKQREYEVFIGGLDRDTTEADVVEVFRAVGDVVEVRLVRRPFHPRSKAFAFVQFATIDQARRAASELRYVQVRGRSCGVTRSNNQEILHLGNICTSWTKDDLLQKLNEFELDNLEDVHLMEDPVDKGKNRGYAFLDFSTHLDALAACCKLQKEDVFLGTNVRADIAFSRSIEPNDEIMSKVRSVFLDGLPASWDEEHVGLHFGQFGEIENIQLASNMPTAKRKDFGFVSFKIREAALECIEKVNKNGISEGNEKIAVRATLKKPQRKRYIPTSGIRRAYMNKSHTRSSLHRPYEDDRSYSRRAMRTKELDSRGYAARMRDCSPLSGEDYSYLYESQGRRHYIKETETYSRSRAEYHEGSSSSKLEFGGYRDFSPRYNHLSRSYSYSDDSDDEVYYIYENEYSPYDNREFEYYDHPTYSGQRRRYADIDDDILVTGSTLKRNQSRSEYEFDGYTLREASKYDIYSRVLPEDHASYERVDYARRSYKTRYLTQKDTSKSYH